MPGCKQSGWRAGALLLAVSLALQPLVAGAQSLIDPDSYRPLSGDRRAYHVGDSLTVLLVESTTAVSAAGTDANSKTGISASASDGNHQFQGGLAVQGDTTGAGQTSRRGQIRANVSVRVVEQLPEGLLRVSGQQLITINDEKQQIRVAGLVRPDDISYENTVLSFRLTDAQIDIVGDGVVTNAQKQNIFFRFFKWLGVL